MKIESSTSIKFTTKKDMTLYLGFADGSTPNIKINGEKVTGANAVIEKEIPAGNYELTKADTQNLFYINLYSKEEDNPETGIKDATAGTLSFNGSAILNPEGKLLRLYTVSGQSIKSSNSTELSTTPLPQGIYVVVAEGETMRFVVL